MDLAPWLAPWLAFVAAAMAMLLIPGPTILLVIGQSLGGGARNAPPLRGRRAMRQAHVVTALNPKGIVFFVAFVPQFIDPARPFLAQAAILVATFVTLAAANAAFYAVLAARLSGAVRRPGLRRALNRTGGAVLVGAGLAVALRRA